ncbi:MAG TPA: hypothetical protein PLO61_04835 [Fimbriimonadaceae bacterium]|nr:hypothetical protein [Fimbriimonadaceae bacterium]HRJ32545.1 hypothetical protein [Fimbriimonadaceae bacterium]
MNSETQTNPEKKKLMVIGALAVVILGIGAFQMTAGSAPPTKSSKPKSKKSAAESAEIDPKATQIEQMVAGVLPQRDPFLPGNLPLDAATAKPEPAKPPQAAPPKLPRRPDRGQWAGGGYAPMDPMGSLPPVSPNGQIGIQPSSATAPTTPTISVSGTVLGDRPVAILKDEAGNQRVIPLGGQIDPSTKVVGIERGKVTLERHGKRQTLTAGGTQSDH